MNTKMQAGGPRWQMELPSSRWRHVPFFVNNLYRTTFKHSVSSLSSATTINFLFLLLVVVVGVLHLHSIFRIRFVQPVQWLTWTWYWFNVYFYFEQHNFVTLDTSTALKTSLTIPIWWLWLKITHFCRFSAQFDAFEPLLWLPV